MAGGSPKHQAGLCHPMFMSALLEHNSHVSREERLFCPSVELRVYPLVAARQRGMADKQHRGETFQGERKVAKQKGTHPGLSISYTLSRRLRAGSTHSLNPNAFAPSIAVGVSRSLT